MSRPLSMVILIAVVMGIAILTGCSGSGPFVSTTRLQALEHNNRGIEAESRGSRDLARSEFSMALQLSSSIDDADGTVVALLNLSRLSRRGNALAVAETYMQRALSRASAVPGRNVDVAFEMTLLLLAQGETESAKITAQRAVELSTEKNRAACYNLLARVEHQLGDDAGAETHARHALAAIAGEADLVEAANAYRLLGELAMTSGRHDESVQFFKEALTRDKVAGISPRIAGDLRFLARLANAAGNSPEAINYWHRAFEVSLSGGDRKAALEDLAAMAEICRKSGDKLQADALERQRLELSGEDSGAFSR